ncbi:MAG: DUF2723 domain-containing protein [Bacteroidales bacterium]|nr:DUF2723 domain-containing protein [Bacteroidales bacterium]
MKNYKLVNNLLGWITFAVSAVVYILTIEPTASFWDCPEFISSAMKLEVGHPPGAPFFMLAGNFFTHFASDPTQVARMVNTMSALLSALTIMFLFWSITHLAKKLLIKGDTLTTGQFIAVMGSGLVGAFAYTFSDTFWFSAVEGEVYAFSSFFTAVVFWLILKWENASDSSHANRFIVLIAYLTGLSIGVHLLNLLCIPAIVLVYYYKKNPDADLKGSLKALLLSFILVGLVMYGMIPGLVKVAGWFELLFVNEFGMPFNTGLIVYILVVSSTIIWGLYETTQGTNQKRIIGSFLASVSLVGLPFLTSGAAGIFLAILLIGGLGWFLVVNKKWDVAIINTALLCLMSILIGYSSYAIIIIRSAANTPMDQNSPEDIFTLGRYLSREQYGDRPLLYGETFVSDVQRDSQGAAVVDKGAPIWVRKVKKNDKEKDQYYISGYKEDYEYVSETKMLLPRMYSRQANHIQAYKVWSDFKGTDVTYDRMGEKVTVKMPTMIENIKFFISYQMNFMYWRYFFWNFSGRQNDIQGNGEVNNGNWITGINFIDKFLVGDQSNLPPSMENNKGHNKYYMLPLILGIIGLLFQAYSGQKGIQGFWVTFFLFFMTGLAIVFYLNQYPYQPRERDYAFAGSFYAYCIWIGLGVAAIAKGLSKYTNETIGAIVATLACLLIPAKMGAENWDDHDRSNRYTCRDFGYNYLVSCPPNAVIFTNGDNDTFPLWYNQEVEGVRTDVRVCNLSYLQTDWYIDQMRREAYDSKPLPISFEPWQYAQGTRDVVYVTTMLNEPMDVTQAMNIVKSDDPNLKIKQGDQSIEFIPTENLYIPVDTMALRKSGTLVPHAAVLSKMEISLKGKQYLGKQEMVILDMLANSKFKRPICYAVTVGNENYLNLNKYFSLEGLTYRITPQAFGANGGVNSDVMYDNMVNKFKWGGIGNPKVYLDENNLRMCKTFRFMFGKLINQLLVEGKKDKALKALDYCMKVLPPSTIPNDYSSLTLAEAYYHLGQKEKAEKITEDIANNTELELKWYNSLTTSQYNSVTNDVGNGLAVLQSILQLYSTYNPKLAEKHMPLFQMYSAGWGTNQKGQ